MLVNTGLTNTHDLLFEAADERIRTTTQMSDNEEKQADTKKLSRRRSRRDEKNDDDKSFSDKNEEKRLSNTANRRQSTGWHDGATMASVAKDSSDAVPSRPGRRRHGAEASR